MENGTFWRGEKLSRRSLSGGGRGGAAQTRDHRLETVDIGAIFSTPWRGHGGNSHTDGHPAGAGQADVADAAGAAGKEGGIGRFWAKNRQKSAENGENSEKQAENVNLKAKSWIFHAMETFLGIFPRHGKRFSTVWKKRMFWWEWRVVDVFCAELGLGVPGGGGAAGPRRRETLDDRL